MVSTILLCQLTRHNQDHLKNKTIHGQYKCYYVNSPDITKTTYRKIHGQYNVIMLTTQTQPRPPKKQNNTWLVQCYYVNSPDITKATLKTEQYMVSTMLLCQLPRHNQYHLKNRTIHGQYNVIMLAPQAQPRPP